MFKKQPKFYTTEQAARVLGLKSETTINNWLHSGNFPGATQDAWGVWQFDPEIVWEITKRVIDLRRRIILGEVIELPDLGDDVEPPILG